VLILEHRWEATYWLRWIASGAEPLGPWRTDTIVRPPGDAGGPSRRP
jgi:hypothetical protein